MKELRDLKDLTIHDVPQRHVGKRTWNHWTALRPGLQTPLRPPPGLRIRAPGSKAGSYLRLIDLYLRLIDLYLRLIDLYLRLIDLCLRLIDLYLRLIDGREIAGQLCNRDCRGLCDHHRIRKCGHLVTRVEGLRFR